MKDNIFIQKKCWWRQVFVTTNVSLPNITRKSYELEDCSAAYRIQDNKNKHLLKFKSSAKHIRITTLGCETRNQSNAAGYVNFNLDCRKTFDNSVIVMYTAVNDLYVFISKICIESMKIYHSLLNDFNIIFIMKLSVLYYA